MSRVELSEAAELGGCSVPVFERSIEIKADQKALFELTQDYDRRLAWDPFLKEARLLHGAEQACVGARAWCVAKIWGGMETEYVSYNPPDVVAVKMTNGPAVFDSFAGSWRFSSVAPGVTRVVFRYNFSSRPAWLSFILDPVVHIDLSRNARRRLAALKWAVEETSILRPV